MRKVNVLTSSSVKFPADQADVLAEHPLELALRPEAELFALA